MITHFNLPRDHKATRITSNNTSLIDNIFTNNVTFNCLSVNGQIVNDLSDHLPIFSISRETLITTLPLKEKALLSVISKMNM